ncbi:hypothetical protein [Grimontia hollisae]|uniref:hypothetical protein n=1 Tax=Grimontia hollisae TaxID=673 RepID=UPI0012ACC313|nr:hypothetical protein [Grimontia hollisae]
MIPGIGGGLSAGGSMPISAGGGAAGPSQASGSNIGGIKNGAINFGTTGLMSVMPWVVVGVIAWVVLKK